MVHSESVGKGVQYLDDMVKGTGLWIEYGLWVIVNTTYDDARWYSAVWVMGGTGIMGIVSDGIPTTCMK